MLKNIHSLLFADDDVDDCMFFKDALAQSDIKTELTMVHDGAQLMDYLSQTPDDNPDILFLDLNMPRKSGLECLIEIKSNEKLKSIPVVIFSTSCEKNITDKLYDGGAHFCIRKPGDYDELRDVIDKAILRTYKKDRPAKEHFLLS